MLEILFSEASGASSKRFRRFGEFWPAGDTTTYTFWICWGSAEPLDGNLKMIYMYYKSQVRTCNIYYTWDLKTDEVLWNFPNAILPSAHLGMNIHRTACLLVYIPHIELVHGHHKPRLRKWSCRLWFQWSCTNSRKWMFTKFGWIYPCKAIKADVQNQNQIRPLRSLRSCAVDWPRLWLVLSTCSQHPPWGQTTMGGVLWNFGRWEMDYW